MDLGLRLLQDSLHTKGLRGTVRRAVRIVRATPAARQRARADRTFDERRGVETARWVRRHALDTNSPNVAHAVRYEPSREEAVSRGLATITALGESLEEFVFVDYGCGKGRALILAADHPFERVVGVEFAASLADVARRNVAGIEGAAGRVVVHTQDATDFEPPASPLVLYFFNPFGPSVLRRVLARVRASIAADPRAVYLILVEAPRLSCVPAETGFARIGVVDSGRVEVFGAVSYRSPARAGPSS